MTKIITALAIGFVLAFAAPASAADSAACAASWTKMDAKQQGYVMHTDAKDEMTMLTKAGQKIVGADRMTDKEYMAACIADIFTVDKK